MKDRVYKKVWVSKRCENSIRDGHPWIYEGEVEKKSDGIKNGNIVDIISSKDKYLGSGFYNDNSKIRVRLLSRNANDIFDRDFFKRRINYALEYRLMVMKNELNAFRVIYGEADELPGLTVDKFNDILSVQILSLGIDQRRDIILQLLYEVMEEHGFKIKGIYLRNDVDIRIKEGLKEEKGWYDIGLPIPDSSETEIVENNIKYYVDFINGQKTGFFLDQKYNRLLVRYLAFNHHVLDCCTHTGSFAMNAYLGGALSVTACDISSKALSDAKRNFMLNNMKIDTIKADIFELLKKLGDEKTKKYDMIILDPPPFTKSRKTVCNALKGYEEINYLAMKSLPRGGILVTASCSHFATRELFLDAIHKASIKANVKLKQIAYHDASFDHPILIGVDETAYLKLFVFQVF